MYELNMVHEAGWESLANAVIVQAAKDFRRWTKELPRLEKRYWKFEEELQSAEEASYMARDLVEAQEQMYLNGKASLEECAEVYRNYLFTLSDENARYVRYKSIEARWENRKDDMDALVDFFHSQQYRDLSATDGAAILDYLKRTA